MDGIESRLVWRRVVDPRGGTKTRHHTVYATAIDSHPTPGVPLSQWLLLAPRERAFRLVPPAERRILLSLRPVRVCLCRRDAIQAPARGTQRAAAGRRDARKLNEEEHRDDSSH